MAANYQQQIPSSAQMMPLQRPQQQQQQQQQQMDATQLQMQQVSNQSKQVKQFIISAIRSQPPIHNGWQVNVSEAERAELVYYLFVSVRIANGNQASTPVGLRQLVEVALRFERECFQTTPHKDLYNQTVIGRAENIRAKKKISPLNFDQQSTDQHNTTQTPTPVQIQRSMQTQPNQQSFSHLQHQVQSSQVPGQQTQQLQLQQNVTGIQGPTSAIHNLQFQTLPPKSTGVNSRSGIFPHMSEEAKNELRASLQASMDPTILQKCQAQGIDPLMLYFRQQASSKLHNENIRRTAQKMQMVPPGQTMAPAPSMQQQRSMQQSPMNGQVASLKVGASSPDFASFMGSVDVAAHQQQQGVMAQAEGQVVVPASSGSGMQPVNPQSVLVSGLGIKMNDLRGSVNTDSRSQTQQQQQQQQQLFHAQQFQNQRLQHAQLSQAQARLNAAANNQQLSLQGQTSGIGPGQMAHQPSPLLSALNPSMRASAQQMSASEPSSSISSSRYGQPLDQRFISLNPGQSGGSTVMTPGAVFASMGGQPSLQSDLTNEATNKWSSGSSTPGGKPQISLSDPARSEQQLLQHGQMNVQTHGGQFSAPNPGQRTPNNPVAMSPQQQMILEQQTTNLRRQSGSVLQPNLPSNIIAIEQKKLLQMDGADIPPAFTNQPIMPQGYPPEIQKWGQLKQWVAANPNLGSNVLETIKLYQTLHFKSLVKRANSQLNQQSSHLNPGPINHSSSLGPSIAAPVAHMGQTQNLISTSLPNANLRQIRTPTMADIQNIRNHPNGKMLNATDDQIRTVYLRTAQQQQQFQQKQLEQHLMTQIQRQHQPQEQDSQRQLMASQLASSLLSQGDIQPRFGPIPQPQTTAESSPVHGKTAQGAHPKKPVNTSISGQVSKGPNPHLSTTSAVQNEAISAFKNRKSSPVPNVKNLKTSNNETNPAAKSSSAQQPVSTSTPVLQPSQNSASNPPKPRFLTAQQIARLTPEQRKKYELMIRKNHSGLSISNSELEKVQRIQEQVAQENFNPQAIPMNPEMKDQIRTLIKNLIRVTNNLSRAIAGWFKNSGDEERLRAFFRMRTRLAMQFQDGNIESGMLKEEFSISLRDLEVTKNTFNGMVNDLREKFPHLKKQEPAKAVSPNPGLTSSSSTNVQKQQQHQLQHQSTQKPQSSLIASAQNSHMAATSSTFIPGASSPHGTPAYADKRKLDIDIQIPPRKKQKLSSNSTQHDPNPATIAGSDTKTVPNVEQAKPTLVCSEPNCNKRNVIYEKEEELKIHIQEEHTRPLENPVEYTKECLGSSLGLGSDKKSEINSSQEATNHEDATKMNHSSSKQGQSPNIKRPTTPSSTTLNRQDSVNSTAGITSKIVPGLRHSLLREPSKPQPTTKENIPSESRSDVVITDAWNNSTVNPSDLVQVLYPPEPGANGAISDMSAIPGITPNDTPESSKDGISEPTSDIFEGAGSDINVDFVNESWMPYGPRDTDPLSGTLFFDRHNDENFKVLEDEYAFMPFGPFLNGESSMFGKEFGMETSLFSYDGN